MPATPIRRPAIVFSLLLVLAALAGGCGSAATPTPAQDAAACDHWCGNGSATVTLGGATTQIAGGGCYDRGSLGVDARFGDWQDQSGFSYLALIAYRTGGPTPAPATPPAPGASQYPSPTVGGSIDGNPFVLDTDALVTLNANGSGTFSGTDLNGNGPVKGTFNCG